MRAPPLEMAGAFSLGGELTETEPWLRAMHALHVGARPEALPCRTEEYGRVMRAVEELLEEGSGGCICELFASLSVLGDEVTIRRHLGCAWYGENGNRARRGERVEAHGRTECMFLSYL
jgi:hypothetical protein